MPHCSDGEQRAGAAEAGRDLVADEQHVVLAARGGRARRASSAVGELHAGRALHERLDDRPRRARRRARRPARTRSSKQPGSSNAGRAQHREAQRVEERRCRSRRRRPRARRSCRRGTRRRTRGTWCGPSTPWFAQYWNAIFSACSTAAAPSDAKRKCGSSTGTTRASASASSIDDAVAVAEHRRVGDPVELVAQRVVELGDAVAERRDPERRDGVEVAAAVDVDDLVALGAVDEHGRVVGVGRPSA